MKIPTRLLNAYRLADTSGQKYLYALNGCLVTKDSCGHCRIAAADINVIVVSEWDDDADHEPISVIVDRDVCCHAAENYDIDSTLQCDPSKNRITLSDGTKAISSAPVQGNFPGVNLIFKHSNNEARTSVDARKLKQVVDTIVAMHDSEKHGKIEVELSIHSDIVSITRPGTFAAVATLECSPKDKYSWRPEISDLRTEELLKQWQAAVAKANGGGQCN